MPMFTITPRAAPIATTATTAHRRTARVQVSTHRRGGAIVARAAPKSSKKTTPMNTINYQPKADAKEPWWPVDERTGKPPGWFQIVVFAGSQLFIGLVMQPAAVVYQSLFDPIINK